MWSWYGRAAIGLGMHGGRSVACRQRGDVFSCLGACFVYCWQVSELMGEVEEACRRWHVRGKLVFWRLLEHVEHVAAAWATSVCIKDVDNA